MTDPFIKSRSETLDRLQAILDRKRKELAEEKIRMANEKLRSSDTDTIEKPTHYRHHDMECIDELVLVFGKDAAIAFCKCNVWKYRYRAGVKTADPTMDNDKSDVYIDMIEWLEHRYPICPTYKAYCDYKK